MTAVLTIDLEDWFHSLEPEPDRWSVFEPRVEVGTAILLELLAKTGSHATFFVLGDLARRHQDLIRRIQDAGHEIGTHGMYHRFVYAQTPSEFRADLRASVDILQDITGGPIRSYRAPYFSITRASLWALEILRDEGILFDSSIFPIRNSRYGIPGARRLPHEIVEGLIEWPVSTLATPFGNLPFAGGVYFRFLPWRSVYYSMQYLCSLGEPLLMYLHPWELDPQQPRFRSPSAFLNFRHYWRLGATAGKLEHMLNRLTFLTLADAAAELDQERLP